jgi:inositol-phosphate transport system ATP-binding protein
MRVELQALTKRFGEVTAVNAVDLEIGSGEFVALLGPSGCGKTTTLLLVAGIYQPTDGSIVFGDRRVEHLSPAERRIGMVFQSYALYPHMSVADNIAFPLDVQRGVSRAERDRRVREAVDLVQIPQLLDRRPAQLSGGQQQRVALARALVKRPDILLLDEPLSNLDARLRHEMRAEIKRLQKDVGITSIFVTHDQHEALTMADRVAVMRDGDLEAYADPNDLYHHPPNRFVAEFVGDPKINMVTVELSRVDGALVGAMPDARLRVRIPADGRADGVPERAVLGIRPEDIILAEASSQGAAGGEGSGGGDDEVDARGEVYVVEPSGREQIIDVRLGEHTIRVLSPPTVRVEPGQAVGLRFDPHRIHLFATDDGRRLEIGA